jgi:ribosome-associated protein
MLVVNHAVTIPDDELRFTFSRSSGPGGQNVNKVNSKATLHWNLTASACLPDDVKARFAATYRTRLTTRGDVVIASQEHRDQPKNIDACCERLKAMILAVWRAPKKRRPTKRTKGSQERRLQAKRERSQVKRGRQDGSGE